MTDNLIEISGLELAYRQRGQWARTVGPLDLAIRHSEALGIIGESGAGKSTLGLELLGLLGYRGGKRIAGSIRTDLPCRRMALIPQDPAAALDPLFSVGSQLAETGCGGEQIREVLDRVGLGEGRLHLKSYPHELSGGMRQRVLIAMALLQKPGLVIADEPTSSLDVTLQAEVLQLFRDIRRSGIAFLFISHNLPLAASFCDRIAVMRTGQLVETGSPQEIFLEPRHPYTRQLVRAVCGVRR